jgi:UDPglucose--hexose-1-phosphate uridylyltransferase
MQDGLMFTAFNTSLSKLEVVSMSKFDFPHRRLNLLTGEWVLVSPQRDKRPWLGQIEKLPMEDLPAYDPDCYLCPGNERAGGRKNPAYTSTFVFENDFPALLSRDKINTPLESPILRDMSGSSLYVAELAYGVCKVVCFSPRHDLSLPELPIMAAEAVVKTWTEQTLELRGRADIKYVQVFENKGAMMGCSNPHPHSQIWATSIIPNEPAKELTALQGYQKEHRKCLLCDYLGAERANGERLVTSNDHFTAIVPYWAVWPFEILIIAHRHLGSLFDLDNKETNSLADLLQRVTAKYDNLFGVSFPYSMGIHQAPCDGGAYSECHLHIHFYPPLLRSATVRKFMVGFEMMAMPQRDLTPEKAAGQLRELSEVHYRCGRG